MIKKRIFIKTIYNTTKEIIMKKVFMVVLLVFITADLTACSLDLDPLGKRPDHFTNQQ